MIFKTTAIPLDLGVNSIDLSPDFEILNVINYESKPYVIVNHSENKSVKVRLEVCYGDIILKILPTIKGQSTCKYIGSTIIYNSMKSDQLIHVWLHDN